MDLWSWDKPHWHKPACCRANMNRMKQTQVWLTLTCPDKMMCTEVQFCIILNRVYREKDQQTNKCTPLILPWYLSACLYHILRASRITCVTHQSWKGQIMTGQVMRDTTTTRKPVQSVLLRTVSPSSINSKQVYRTMLTTYGRWWITFRLYLLTTSYLSSYVFLAACFTSCKNLET